MKYKSDKDLGNKFNKYDRTCGSVTKTLKTKTRREIQLKFVKMVALLTVLYERKTWTRDARGIGRNQSTK
jgi:hypothetical protein